LWTLDKRQLFFDVKVDPVNEVEGSSSGHVKASEEDNPIWFPTWSKELELRNRMSE